MAIWGRFTQRAQQAVTAAQQAAVALRQPYVGTEHILLGLLKDPLPMVSELLPENITYDTVFEAVKSITQEDENFSGGILELTPRSKKILERSILESKQLQHSFVGSEHFWLALLQEGEGVAISLLRNLGLDVQIFLQKLLEKMQSINPENAKEEAVSSSESKNVV